MILQLERFLIDNRDDYLKFSSRNYTVEQKQFNNMLTERLIELAEKHSYIFDPEEFNFVAIRDRIRCYYKSYVQTARKRGLLLPSDKSKGGEHDDDNEDEHAKDFDDKQGRRHHHRLPLEHHSASNEHGDDSQTEDKEVRE